MSSVFVLTPEGVLRCIPLPDTGTDAVRRTLTTAIDCINLDCVRLTSRWDMWLDDNGMYTAQINYLATKLAAHHGYDLQPYWGTVVLAGCDDEGNTVGFTREQHDALHAHLHEVLGG